MSNVDRRQFIIMREPLKRDDFLHLDLACGLVLSYHRDLKVQTKEDNVLLGYAFSCTKENIDLANAENEMKEWAGRWILITKEALYMDVCGTLGIFYGKNKSGNLLFSSSLHLLSETLHSKWIADYQIKRGDFKVFDFYPIPYTPYQGIMALLPTQKISLPNGSVLPRKDYDFKRYQQKNLNEVKECFIECFANVLKNIGREFADEIWIPLTGGVDSRTIFAIAHQAELPFNTYTLIRDDLKPWDRKIPIKISKITKVSHHLIDSRYNKQNTKDRMEEILAHCGGKVTVGTEIEQYLSGADVPIKRKAVVLWGTTIPVCAHIYHSCFPPLKDKEDILKLYDDICDSVLSQSNIHGLSIPAWLENAYQNPINGVDWRTRQYWEQRVGAWQMLAHQMLDMLDSIRIAPVNCQMLIELMYSANNMYLMNGMNFGKDFQKDIIMQCCYPISKIHYGEPTNLGYRIICKLKKYIDFGSVFS